MCCGTGEGKVKDKMSAGITWGGNDGLNLFPGSALTPGLSRRQRPTKTGTAPRTTALSVKLSAIRSILSNYIRGFVLVLQNSAVEWFGVQLRWIVMSVNCKR
ncbi:MAG: hypothetical protein A4E65_00888 [Syntrophorhabdus sp. PtaU1.Bin153]|nr:MAG: hypothetical protein A4E65_00888 [Syntrophorhabdus sp. PtaU1.Bin153]